MSLAKMICRRNGFCTCYRCQIVSCLSNERVEEAKSFLQEIINSKVYNDTSGWTLIHYSAFHGLAKMTQYLIETEFHVDVLNDCKTTPLMLAISKQHSETVKVLLVNNANIYLTDENGKSILDLGFNTENIYPMIHARLTMEMLFDKINSDYNEGNLTDYLLNSTDNMKIALLTFGSVEIVEYMLKFCCSIDFHDAKLGNTALHYSIIWLRYENANMLINLGADVDALNKQGWSPLHYYHHSYFNNVDVDSQVLKGFLQRTNRLAEPNTNGSTDIEILLKEATKKTVKAILTSDIDIDTCFSPNNSLLLHLIKTNHNSDVLELLDELTINFDVNERYENGYTPLIMAASRADSEKVKFLLEHGADVNAKTPDGQSALSLAWRKYNPHSNICGDREINEAKITELLLQYEIDGIQEFFAARSDIYLYHSLLRTTIIIAHLAMLEKSSLTPETLEMINTVPDLQAYFDMCAKQVAKLKEYKVYRQLTVFKLMMDKQEKTVSFARNQELLSAVSASMDNLKDLEPYYVNRLQGKMSRGLETAKLQEKVAESIKSLTGLCDDVLMTIVDFLDHQDYRNLCNV